MSDKTKVEPLPCPFCGREPTTYQGVKWAIVRCGHCTDKRDVACYSESNTMINAIAKWNMRA